MATEAHSLCNTETSDLATHPSPAEKPRGRVWPILVILAAFWVFELSVYSIEMAAFTRFVGRFSIYLALFLVFLVWWFTYRGFRLRDRFLAVGAMFGLATLTGLVSHKSIAGPPLVLSGLQYCMTTWAVWVAVSRYWSPRVRMLGLLGVMALTFSYFTLIRWEGLYGTQEAQIRWRWEPSAEERFLAQQAKRAKESSNTTASAPAKEAEPAQPWTIQPGDVPDYRGVGRTGVLEGVVIDPANWSTTPPKQVWRKLIGPGWSTMIVVDGHLVTQEQRGEREAVVCYDAETGDEIWVHADEIRFEEGLSGPGPRSTPTFDPRSGGRIYTLGAKGKLNCLEATSGKLVWSQDIVAESGATPPQWGYSVSPLVVDNLVVVFAGGENKSVLAYDADTGKLVWTAAGGTQSYSSPQLVNLLGQRQILMHDNKALRSLDPTDGRQLWQWDAPSAAALPQLQPYPLSDHELVVASEPGIALLDLSRENDAWTIDVKWDSKALKPAFNHFAVHEGYVYGLDDGILVCVDLETGERKWKKGRYYHGQILLLRDQDALLILGEKGEVAVVATNPKQLEELGRFQAIEGKTWNHPVVAHGKLCVRNGNEIACYDIAP